MLALRILVAIGLIAFQTEAQCVDAPAARVFGTEIRCRDLGTIEPGACAIKLLRRARAEVARAFIERNHLAATSAEVERLAQYNQAFERHDRAQRARKLVELDARLAGDRIPRAERDRLEEFRRVLLRMSRYEADVDAGVELPEPIAEATLREWIETAKLNAALYARYGGVVGITTYGAYAHGAMRMLIDEHIERGDVRLLDPAVAEHFFAALAAPPALVHVLGEPDFTPFWERPIPASYVPD